MFTFILHHLLIRLCWSVPALSGLLLLPWCTWVCGQWAENRAALWVGSEVMWCVSCSCSCSGAARCVGVSTCRCFTHLGSTGFYWVLLGTARDRYCFFVFFSIPVLKPIRLMTLKKVVLLLAMPCFLLQIEQYINWLNNTVNRNKYKSLCLPQLWTFHLQTVNNILTVKFIYSVSHLWARSVYISLLEFGKYSLFNFRLVLILHM